MAYASALGNLEASEAIDTLFDLMHSFENQGARLELALSLARMTGSEHHFVRLLRQARDDTGTAIAQELVRLKSSVPLNTVDETAFIECMNAFAREELDTGKALFAALLQTLPEEGTLKTHLLQGCADGLEDQGFTEYVLLALHVLEAV